MVATVASDRRRITYLHAMLCAAQGARAVGTRLLRIAAQEADGHRVPLSMQALRIFKELHSHRESERERRTRTVAVGLSEPAQERTARPPRAEDVRARGRAIAREVSRTRSPPEAASLMVGGGVPRLVVSKILNHVETGVTAVYDRHSYDPEKRAALDYWGNRLEQVVSTQHSAKVLAFAGR